MYEALEVKLCTEAESITVQDAKDLLGWTEETKEEKFGTDYLIKDFQKKKIRCHNNVTNRPLYKSNVDKLKADIQAGAWKFNGEPIIVSKSGKILNGQHQLVALVLSYQEWEELKEGNEPTIDKLVVYGVEDDDEIINTMDTCKPRSLADVIYRSSYFEDYSAQEQKKIANICSYAIKTMWERLGDSDAFSARKQTHAASLTFLENHPKLIEAVEFVYTENVEQSLLRFGALGTLAGMLYLMGCSKSDPEAYDGSESKLNWDNWETACEYFVGLSSDLAATKPVVDALQKLLLEEGGSRDEKLGLVVGGWTGWLKMQSSKKLKTVGKVALNYTDQDGVKTLDDYFVGGIDGFSAE